MIFLFNLASFLFIIWLLLKADSIEEQNRINNKSNIKIGDRMRKYETDSTNISYIPGDESFVVRLDGRNFSTFSQKLQKPYDSLLNEAMLLTARDMAKEFHPSSTHVQSDEITLVFPANKTSDSQHLYAGQVYKILSVLAGYCSTRFTCNFTYLLSNLIHDDKSDSQYKELYDVYYTSLLKDNILHNAKFCFDSRIVVLPEYEVVNYLIWRSNYIGYTSYIETLANYYLGKKNLIKVSTKDRAELLRKNNIDISSHPSHHRYGWLIKINKEEKGGLPMAKSLKLYFHRHTREMLFTKYWNNVNNKIVFSEVKSFN